MKTYADPYVCGVALGLVLLASFAMTGRGLGASGAFASTSAAIVHAVAPSQQNAYFDRYLQGDAWLLFEIAGVGIGGFASARLARRVRWEVARGPRIGARGRLLAACAGGAVMGGGAVLARGCTSGLALSGGAVLSAGSWLFIGAAFASGFAFAPLVRRAWR